jgi:hypothetical protein
VIVPPFFRNVEEDTGRVYADFIAAITLEADL